MAAESGEVFYAGDAGNLSDLVLQRRNQVGPILGHAGPGPDQIPERLFDRFASIMGYAGVR